MSNRFPLPGLSIRDILVNRLEIRRMQMARCIPIRQNDLSHLWLGIEPAETKRPKSTRASRGLTLRCYCSRVRMQAIILRGKMALIPSPSVSSRISRSVG
jgi:hypothetical protein